MTEIVIILENGAYLIMDSSMLYLTAKLNLYMVSEGKKERKKVFRIWDFGKELNLV